MIHKLFHLTILLLTGQWLVAQVGIGTATPDRLLEVRSSGSTSLRVHTSSNFAGGSGVELVRGDLFDSPIDWRIVNDGGMLKFTSGNYNLNTSSSERMRITPGQNLGIGTTTVNTKLHVGTGEEASLLNDGYMMFGSSSGTNLILDRNEIQARFNGNASSLFIQSSGGDTYFNNNGGHVMIANGTGALGIGTLSPARRVTVTGNEWQVYLNNHGSAGGNNDWHMGVTSNGWAVGDNQLVFSPTSSSNNSKFRLRNVVENTGTVAPVAILSNGGQELLIDGNEIESTGGSLYVNHNSGHETYLNPSGGQVGVGTTSPGAALTIIAPEGTDPLSIQQAGSRWDMHPHVPDGANPWGSLGWYNNDEFYASISGNTGAWFSISDRDAKHNIRSMPDMLDRLGDVGVYRYTFKSDSSDRKYIGVMAQQLQSVFPEAVRSHEDQTGVAYGQLAAIVLKAIQEQQQIISALEAEIARLESNKQ